MFHPSRPRFDKAPKVSKGIVRTCKRKRVCACIHNDQRLLNINERIVEGCVHEHRAPCFVEDAVPVDLCRAPGVEVANKHVGPLHGILKVRPG